MTIAILAGRDENEAESLDWFINDIITQLKNLDLATDIQVWPNIHSAESVNLALVWRPPLGIWQKFPSLKCIASLAAGVDHLIVDQQLPKNIPVIRVMDPYMANDIVQYVLAYVLHEIKRVDHWQACQNKKLWAKKPPFNFAEKTIGILGLGFLGKKIAETLRDIGLKVTGWSNSKKNISGVIDYFGQDELYEFLSRTDILICMLPLTGQTENILNQTTLSKLKPGACLINLGRGGHLVEEDLISLLNSGHVDSAYLDVFREEPLPAQHLFWSHPKIHITPHIASVTHPQTAVPQLIEAYNKLLAGEKITNEVDLSRGY